MQTLNDWYENCKALDKLTWMDLCNKIGDENLEKLKVLCLIADKLGVYEESRGKWQFLKYSEDNQIFKALNICPDKQECSYYAKLRKKNEKII